MVVSNMLPRNNLASLCTKLRNKNSKQISVALVLGHMAKFDRRLQRMISAKRAP